MYDYYYQRPDDRHGGQPGGYPGGQPGGQPGGHPGGHPGGYPGGHPGGYPGGHPGGHPMSPPPFWTPRIPSWQVGHQGMRNCLYRNTYVWMWNGNEFWYFPTFVGRQIIVGYRWRRNGWVYHEINPRGLRTFQCF